MGALDVRVGFYFAFRLALRAHGVNLGGRVRIRGAIRARWRSRSISFFLPA
ncbi:hypothetical protein [Variovorax sp. OV700]|uniref:hypothetical protein n=1 Tax=Variovorax sp. OV700 TaxID=1882826 RepID=UPI0034A11C80